MANSESPLSGSSFGDTNRKDNWWASPLAVFVGLSLFVLYGLFRTFYPVFNPGAPGITAGSLQSPFFSPLLFAAGPESGQALFGTFPSWWPTVLSSPAILVLWAPLGLRATCYYYRKAYYRAFFQDPTACAVGEPRNDYNGETGLLIVQNVHRYFLYLGLLFIVFLSWDTVKALFWNAPAGAPFWAGTFEIHVGTLVLGLNAVLLAGYTLGCHSLRYLVGGGMRCFSCPNNPRNQNRERAPSDKSISGRYRLWRGVTRLNVNHQTWAWCSLFMVAFADFYVWMVSIGVWPGVTILSLH